MANETRIFRIPPNMPVQAVASHVDHYLRANQGLQVQGASNGEECVLQCRQEKDGWKTVSGMRLATTVQITRTAPDNINVTIGISEWSDKIGAGVTGRNLSLYRKLFDFQHKTRSGSATDILCKYCAAERIRLCTKSAGSASPSDYASGNDGSNHPTGSSSSAASCTDLSKLSDGMCAGKPLLQSLRCTADQTDLPILRRRHHCRK